MVIESRAIPHQPLQSCTANKLSVADSSQHGNREYSSTATNHRLRRKTNANRNDTAWDEWASNMVRTADEGRSRERACVSDTHPQAVKDVVAKGAKSSDSIAEFSRKNSSKPRAIWMMVPAAVVDSVLTSLTPVLAPERHSNRRWQFLTTTTIFAARVSLKSKGIHYVDCGTQRWRVGIGARILLDDRRGASDCEASRSDLQGVASRCCGHAARTPGRTGEPSTSENGYLVHCRARDGAGPLRKDGPQRYRVRE